MEVNMGLEIFDDIPGFGEALKRAFGEEIDAYVVNVHFKESEDDYRYQMKGLDVAAKLDPTKKPIILFSVLEEKELMAIPRFRALIGRRRIGFIKVPFKLNDFRALYQKLLKDTKTEDAVAIELAQLEERDRKMRILKHDLKPWLNVERLAKIIQKAREEVGLVGSDEEIVEQIRKYEQPSKKQMFSGKNWPGVFCDVEGTLLVEDKVNQKALKLLENFAKEGKPITLWTGGDPEEIQKKLFQKEITWKVVSKYDFEGAKVEIAIDDEPQAEFEKKYRIKPEKFIQITPL
jgi:hypothetical protein